MTSTTQENVNDSEMMTTPYHTTNYVGLAQACTTNTLMLVFMLRV